MVFFQNSKKGNAVTDAIVVVVTIMIFAMVSIYGYKAFDEMNTDIQADTSMHNESKAISNNLYGKYANLIDNLFIFMFALLCMFSVIAVFMLDTHPIFFIMTVILLAAVFIVAILLANSFDDMMQDDEISSYANEFTYISWIMQHLLTVIIAVGFIIGTSLFIKFRSV
jgi:Ca2+/Na+ antiporter